MPALVTSVSLFKPESTNGYSYPHHIDTDSLAALPRSAGVYFFEDERQRPLYIGKSVNIRARVLSHLRTPEEARLLQQTRRIGFRRTAGEVGALLLESQLIKDLQPVHNKKLRRTREMCAFRLSAGLPAIVFARDLDFSRAEDLYGLFATRRAALEKLRTLVDVHRLCPVLCGLEGQIAAGRPCFACQLGRCAGACAGREAAHQHALRLRSALDALRVVTWPYAGAVGILESGDGLSQMHVVDHWCYLGTLDAPFESTQQMQARPRFDVDTYAILVRPLVQGQLEVQILETKVGSAVKPTAMRKTRGGKRNP
jgi:excinuclease Cho